MTTNSFGLLPDEDDFPCCVDGECLDELLNKADDRRDEVGE